jgi:cholesterol 25-hydroxylase
MSRTTSSSLWIPRTVILLLLGTGIFSPSLFQSPLDIIYDALFHSKIYQSSTFETFWTVLNYGFAETYYVLNYFLHPYSRLAVINGTSKEAVEDPSRPPKPPHGMTRPQHRLPDAITYVAPLLLLDFTMIKKFAGVPVSDIAASGNYNIPVGTNFLRPTLHNFTLQSPLQTRRALPPLPPTSRRLILELVISFIIYDFVFFLFHLSLHKLPIPFIRHLHAQHHSHAEIHPQITNKLDIVERMGLVLLANFSLNIIGAHVLTRTVFVTVFTALLVEIHSGLDLDWGYDKILPAGWGTGARKHAEHHRDGVGNFAPFFRWWDGLLEMTTDRPK